MGNKLPILQINGFGFLGLGFAFHSPVRRLDQPQASGGLGEHCLSSAAGYGLCAPLGRVAQPRLLAADRGYPVGAANRGRLLWDTFLGKTRKVSSCRAAPGEVVFNKLPASTATYPISNSNTSASCPAPSAILPSSTYVTASPAASACPLACKLPRATCR